MDFPIEKCHKIGGPTLIFAHPVLSCLGTKNVAPGGPWNQLVSVSGTKTSWYSVNRYRVFWVHVENPDWDYSSFFSEAFWVVLVFSLPLFMFFPNWNNMFMFVNHVPALARMNHNHTFLNLTYSVGMLTGGGHKGWTDFLNMFWKPLNL